MTSDERLKGWQDLECDECLGEGCDRCKRTGYDPVRHPELVADCTRTDEQLDDWLAGCCPDCLGEGSLCGCKTCNGSGHASK